MQQAVVASRVGLRPHLYAKPISFINKASKCWSQLSAIHAAAQPPQLRRHGPMLNIRITRNRKSLRTRVLPLQEIAATDSLVPLEFDFLTFLGTTVLVIPLFKQLRISPVLGFLFGGIVLQQLGLLHDITDDAKLSQLGVLFLLFEMGLELSLDRLKALAKYAFGMGSLQVIVCTLIFTIMALPPGHGLATVFLEKVVHAPANLVSIRTLDEAVVIGAALSMSSSAFVLQLLAERGEMPTRFASATLGILLLQDIAVVPFLVLLPLLENGGMDMVNETPTQLLAELGPTALKTVAGLGAVLLAGRLLLRRLFEMVAESRNSETFVALCLLTVTGAAFLTEKLGFSDTLGAFIAGVLLSETSYRTQVEADIKPFRGLLLGLFFVTTGSSINMDVLLHQWDVIFWLMLGLLVTKTCVIAALGPTFGLTRAESIRTGFMLSQSGEFAFVLLSLACQLKVLPNNLNQLLIIVVVLTMALTPALAELGKATAEGLDRVLGKDERREALDSVMSGSPQVDKMESPVVICGFGAPGQMLANMLDSEIAQASTREQSYVAFDLEPQRVEAARRAGMTVVYGDGSRESVLHAAGVKTPRAFAICHARRETALKAAESIRQAFPHVPVFACAQDIKHAAELEHAGVNYTVVMTSQAGLSLGGELLSSLGCSEPDVVFLKRGIKAAQAQRTRTLAEHLTDAVAGGSDSGDEIFVLDQTKLGAPGARQQSGGNNFPSDLAGATSITAAGQLAMLARAAANDYQDSMSVFDTIEDDETGSFRSSNGSNGDGGSSSSSSMTAAATSSTGGSVDGADS